MAESSGFLGRLRSMFRKEQTQPWRDSPAFDDKYLKRIKKNIEDICEENTFGPKVKILMLGPVGAGKSSFIKTIDSIFVGRLTSPTTTGKKKDSLTSKYNEVLIETSKATESKKCMEIYLCDTRGIAIGKPNPTDLDCIIKGKIKNQYLFSDTPITTGDSFYIANPELKDEIHCVVLVFNVTTIEATEKDIFDAMNDLLLKLNDKDIPRIILLTHIDELLEARKEKMSQVFSSKNVQSAVVYVSNKLGTPIGNIMPIVNYEEKMVLSTEINCLAFQAFERMVGYAQDYLKRQTRIRMK